MVRRVLVIAATLACLTAGAEAGRSSAPYPDAAQKAHIDRLIVHYAKQYGVPVSLARKVVQSESEYRPLARNGPYWGLMQIRYDTARGMGYRGPAKGLLDAETNLAFGIAYLANALKAGSGNMSRGHMLYRTGYYYTAKRKGVLKDMIVVRDFKPIGDAPTVLAMAESSEGTGGLWSGEASPAKAAAAPAEPKTASEAIADAIAAPVPRAKPAVQIAAAAAAPADPAPAVPAAKPVAAVQVAATSPAVARPTVVYASVLPFAKPAPLAKAEPLLSAPIVGSELASQPAATAEAADGMPIPRPKPSLLAKAEPAEAPKSKLEIALIAAAAKAGAKIEAERAKVRAAAEPAVTDATLRTARVDGAVPVIVAEHKAMPLPRVRPVVAAD